jgi:drug/metabolite transporter (DMT)-like permease
MTVVRVWLPVAILVAGVLLVVVRGGDETSIEGAAALWGAGLSVALLNWLHRMGVSGDRARDQEDAARAYFDRYGRWPDDTPRRPPSPPARP